MKHVVMLCAAAMLGGILGCSNSTSTTTTTPTIVIPNVGSSWTFQNVLRDSTGKITLTDTSTRVITATNYTIQGYNDVVVTVETYPTRKLIDTVYIRYLSNGDITHLSAPLVTPQLPTWWTAPYTTHTAQNTMYGGNITGTYSHDSAMYTASYVDQENDTVGAVVYPMSVITSTTWQLATSAAKDSLDVVVQKNSFDPTKGFFGNRGSTSHLINGKQVRLQQSTLIAVSLK